MMIKRLFVVAIFALSSGLARSEPIAPDILVLNTANEVLDAIKNDQDIQAGNQDKFYALLEAKIFPHFDFDRMSHIMLGKYWTEASPEQKEAFRKEFIAFALRIYASGMAVSGNQTIKCLPFQAHADSSDVTVTLQLLHTGEDADSVDLSMEKAGNDWKLYDVVLEGISLMQTYRGQFLPLARQSGMDGLIQKLSEKNRMAVRSIAVVQKQ